MQKVAGLVFTALLLALAGCASQQPLFSKPRVVQLPPPTPIPFLAGKRVLVKYNHERFCQVQGRGKDYAIVGPIVERHLAGPGRNAKIISAERRSEKPWTGYDLVAMICVSRATDVQQSIYGQAIYNDLVVVSVEVIQKDLQVVAAGYVREQGWRHNTIWSELLYTAAEKAARTMKAR